MKAKRKAGVVDDAVSGILHSPYGHIKLMFNGRVWPNGTQVINNRIVHETLEHRIPDHWIKTPNDGANPRRHET